MDYWPMVDWSHQDEQECRSDERYNRASDDEVGGHPRWDPSSGSVSLKHDGVEHQTERAVLYRFGERTCWLPMSETTDDGKRITMPKWMMTKNGLEAFGQGGE